MKKNPALKIIKNLIAEFNGEIKENKKEINDCKKDHLWSLAAHLDSVNFCLNYTIDRMKMLCDEIESFEE